LRPGESSYAPVVLTFWGLADYEVNEILEVFVERQDAERMLRDGRASKNDGFFLQVRAREAPSP
jgi:hypothetical protein